MPRGITLFLPASVAGSGQWQLHFLIRGWQPQRMFFFLSFLFLIRVDNPELRIKLNFFWAKWTWSGVANPGPSFGSSEKKWASFLVRGRQPQTKLWKSFKKKSSLLLGPWLPTSDKEESTQKKKIKTWSEVGNPEPGNAKHPWTEHATLAGRNDRSPTWRLPGLSEAVFGNKFEGGCFLELI